MANLDTFLISRDVYGEKTGMDFKTFYPTGPYVRIFLMAHTKFILKQVA